MRPGLLAALALVAALGVLVVSGQASAAPRKPLVAIVGDSTTLLPLPDIEAALTPHYRVVARAVDNMRIAGQLTTMARYDQMHPAVWIFALGTDDAGPPEQPAVTMAAFRRAMMLAEVAPCVVLVTPSEITSLNGPVTGDIVRAEYALSHAMPHQYHVLPWGTLAYARPGLVNDVDAVHETLAGDTEIATLESQALSRWCHP